MPAMKEIVSVQKHLTGFAYFWTSTATKNIFKVTAVLPQLQLFRLKSPALSLMMVVVNPGLSRVL